MSGMTREEKQAAIALLEGDEGGDLYDADSYVDAVYEQDEPSYDELVGAGVEAAAAGGDEIERAQRILHRTSDQLMAKSAMRDANAQLLRQSAPFARINPPSAVDRMLGNQADLNFGQIQQVVAWTGENEETVPVTITCGVQPKIAVGMITVPIGPVVFPDAAPFPAGLPPNRIAFEGRPICSLQFGTKGAMAKVEVDIGTGIQFTVNASAIVLSLALESSFALVPLQVPQTCFGMISFYPCVRAVPMTRTFNLDPVAATQFVGLPPFAKSVTLWRDDIGDEYKLHFFNNPGQELYVVDIPANAIMNTPVPLSGDIDLIEVEAVGGGGGQRTLIFNLAL